MGFTPKLSFTFLILLQVFIIAQGQVPLQVEFDRGTPLARDPIPASSLSSDKPQNGLLNDDSLAWRLPRNFVPTEYDVELTPIITDDAPALGAQWDVPGKVTIHFKPLTNTTRILLHSKDITINSSQLLDPETGEDIFIYSSTQPHETLSLGLSRSLEINKEYLLKFEFVSKVKEGLDGLYRSSYFDPISNSTKWIASTQMEALHARQLFPCFDEPSYKAIFHFTIGRKNEHVALANAQSTRNMSMVGVPGWTWESFAATPVMSPYLIAIIISEFKFVDVRNLPGGGVFGKQVRTYAPEHYINRDGGIYATEKADLLLRFFEDYYVEKYPLDKMDSAAVPAFFFGAMENYGLNIYRESALLYFPDESTEAERYRITNILSHELAHQWFGNLVTTAWWTHIWLNEGFATYLAAQGVASAGVGEDFEAWDRFINDAVQNSMGFDARPDYSHTVKIDEEDWITRGAMDWFDRMAYEKGGSLIRMMNGFLTEPVLKAGLLAYLNAMQFQAATQDDLFFHLNTQAKAQSKIPDDLTMKQIMDTWTLQPGFPLIRVSVAGPQSVYVSQERFINNEASRQLKQDLTGLWYVPLTVSSGAAPQPAIEWLYNDIAMRTLRTDTSQWVIVNNGANGYFRTLYDAPLTKLLKEQLEADHTFINAVTRSQLLDDYFTAAWQKYTPIENALGLASYLGNETNIVVWNSVLNNLRTPFNLLSNSGSFYTSLRDFLHPRIKSAMEKTGGIQQSLPEMKGGMPVLRHLQFLDWLCAFEDADCVNYALSLVNDWKAQPATNTIRRDIKPVVYCSAVAHGTDEHFNFIKEQYAVPGITAKQQGSLLDALVCTKETSRIKEVLEGILQDTYYVSDDNRRTILQTIARNPNARSQLVQFLRGNFQAIVDRLNGTSSIVSSITALSGFASTQSELEDIQLLLSENPSIEQGSPAAIATAVNAIKSNIAWVAEYAANLRTYSQTA